MEFIYKKYISYCVWICSPSVREKQFLCIGVYKKKKILIIYKCVHLLSLRRTYFILEVIFKTYISYCVSMCSLSVAEKDYIQTIYFLLLSICSSFVTKKDLLFIGFYVLHILILRRGMKEVPLKDATLLFLLWNK